MIDLKELAKQVRAKTFKKGSPPLKGFPVIRPQKVDKSECIWRGEDTGERIECVPCKMNGRKVQLKILSCEIHGKCTVESPAGHACCKSCKDRTPFTQPIRFDETNLAVGQPGKRFNASIIEYGDSYLMAYRDGWAGSNIHIVRLGRDLKPIGDPVLLNLHHSEAAYGREDPRLFWYGPNLHICFIGVMARPSLHTNVLFARLSCTRERATFAVEDVFHPQIPGRNLWEKNHSYFEHDRNLYAIYSINPHTIMQVWGNRTEFRYRTPWETGWSTELRGGASPVRVGDEFWSFFHTSYRQSRPYVYSIGLYTFEARPPFRPLRIIREPLDVADRATKPSDQYAAVLFPCGAARRGQEWVVSMGVHDRWAELRSFRHADLERQLLPVKEEFYDLGAWI